MSTSTCFPFFSPLFFSRTERRPFNPERESIVRLCTARLLSFFFFHLSALRRDSYNVLLLFKTAINQRAFNYGGERRGSSALLVSLDIFRRNV